MNNNFKRYIIFWISQAISQLGSAMTGFSLILWVYTQNGSAMTVSLLSFFNYVPYIIASLFAGNFVDTHSKKKIMLAADTMAAVCAVAVLALNIGGCLQIWNIYVVNFVLGFMNAFQGPASNVAIGRIVPKDKLAQVSGMNSFSGNLVLVLSPIFAAALFAMGGLKLILAIDLVSFLFAFCVLLFVINIPEDTPQKTDNTSVFSGCAEGVRYLRNNRGIFMIIITLQFRHFLQRRLWTKIECAILQSSYKRAILIVFKREKCM